MDQAQLAVSLLSATDEERELLLTQNSTLADVGLAWALKATYDNLESSDVMQARQASQSLNVLARFTGDNVSRAVAAWVEGMAVLDDGQLEQAVLHLDRAESQFLSAGQILPAAHTQVSKFRALAMQGQYEEAIACGLRARDVFSGHHDILSIGKIEQSLGNLQFMLDRYILAEGHYNAARQLYETTDDQKQLAQIDNCLAMTLMLQHRFQEAARLYEQARIRAEAAGLEMTLAEIETNQGCLALYQGRYDRALDLLERARRRYAVLDMPHNSALADLEIADAYLELHLNPESAAIYERVIPVFSEYGMAAEQARALTGHARARIGLGQFNEARPLLSRAGSLYEAAGNEVGKALVTLIEAQAYYDQRDYIAAAGWARETEAPFAAVHAWGRVLLARWLQAEAARTQGNLQDAETLLHQTLRESEHWSVTSIIQECHTSLGLLAAARHDPVGAEAAFKRAIASIEESRAPLPAEEFRTAFLANKLTPYTEMVRLCLADGSPSRVAEALGYIERARSRALLDTLVGAAPGSTKALDAFEAGLLERLAMLREELNWFYSQMNLPGGDLYARGAEVIAEFQQQVRERESAIAEITLQLRQLRAEFTTSAGSIDITELMSDLGADTALVEYYSLDERLLAFVLTDEGIDVVQLPEAEHAVEKSIRQLHFQLGTLRHRVDALYEYLPELTTRTRQHLGRLYEQLLRPLENYIGERRLVVVPHQVLHYVPFQALHNGSAYLIEEREVCCVPSAAVLRHCLATPRHRIEHATLLGFSDQRNPRAREEVLALAGLFPGANMLLDEQASRATVLQFAASSQVLHMACHGNFRMDNPAFSSLQLADGWLTVRDVYALDLNACQLVTLSACETGVSYLAPGDEWIGLARGFFSAGSPSLVVSQWIVDDEATARLMLEFYSRLRAGDGPAAALRAAQCQLLKEKSHPYFWAPFVVLGRW